MTESVSDLIHKWNEQRLDLFAISQPNSDTGEFHGVIRFYHKENGYEFLFLSRVRVIGGLHITV